MENNSRLNPVCSMITSWDPGNLLQEWLRPIATKIPRGSFGSAGRLIEIANKYIPYQNVSQRCQSKVAAKSMDELESATVVYVGRGEETLLGVVHSLPSNKVFLSFEI